MSEMLDLVVVGDRLLDVLDRDLAVLHGEEVAQRSVASASDSSPSVKVG